MPFKRTAPHLNSEAQFYERHLHNNLQPISCELAVKEQLLR